MPVTEEQVDEWWAKVCKEGQESAGPDPRGPRPDKALGYHYGIQTWCIIGKRPITEEQVGLA